MDLLSQRYANPCFFMDGMLQTGRFSGFVSKVVETYNSEKEEQIEWDVYLHKVWNQTFAEYKETIEINRQNRGMTPAQMEAIIQQSNDILNNFNPEQGGE